MHKPREDLLLDRLGQPPDHFEPPPGQPESGPGGISNRPAQFTWVLLDNPDPRIVTAPDRILVNLLYVRLRPSSGRNSAHKSRTCPARND